MSHPIQLTPGIDHREDSAPTKGWLRVGRFRVPYLIASNVGPTLICVNGVAQSMGAWRPFCERFASNHRVVVFDFPGQGKAEIVAGDPGVTFDEQIAIVEALVAAVAPLSPIDMIGTSWGGIVASAYAASPGARLSKLILASFGARPNAEILRVSERGRHLVDNDQGHLVGRLIIDGFGEELPDEFKERILAQFETLSREHLMAFYHHTLFVGSLRSVSELVDVRDIRARTLIVNGACDTIVDIEDTRRFAAQLPDGEVCVVPGAGHFLHFERPAIMELYEAFLRS